MLDRFKQIFDTDAPPQIDDSGERLKLATCVILIEVATIDEEFADDEKRRIVDILKKRYALTDDDAIELMDAATRSRSQSVDLWKFTNQLNQLCTNQEKIQIVQEVWRVVVADGGIHGHESHFMRGLGKLLNLTPKQIIDQKLKVLEEARAEPND